MSRKFFLYLMAVLLLGTQTWAQISISSATPVTENFDGIGTTTTASLPTNWKMTAAGAGTSAAWTTSGNLAAVSQGASSGTPSAGGRYNWGNGTTTTDRAIGFMTSGSYASPNGIMAYYRNNSGTQITSLVISFDIERYRINSSTFSLAFFSSTNGSSWTAQSAGDIATSVFPTGTSSYTFTGGTSVTKSVTLTGVNIASGSDIYFKWVFTNTGGSNSQGLGLDNVSLTATLFLTPPALTALTVDNDVDHSIPIGFTDDATWRSAITAVQVGGTALTLTTDYTITAGAITLLPSGGNTLLTTSGSKVITVKATGYTDATVTQQINAGAVSASVSTVSVSPALSLGNTSTATLTARDQYGNAVSGYVFKDIPSVINNNAVTTESYTVNGASFSVTQSAQSVTATDAGGVATFPITIPPFVDANDGLSVQVYLNNATTGVSSALTFTGPSSPTIAVSALNPASFGSVQINTNSTDAVYSVSGINLTDNITITAPTGFTISTTSGGTYTSSLTLTKSGSTVSATPVYVRFSPTAMNSYSGTITNVSSGATTQTVAVNGLGGDVPTASTSAATSLTINGALLNGSVTANNASTTVTFEYGLTTSYGSAVAASQSPVTGTSATVVSGSVSGLASGTEYHFRTKAVSPLGTVYGSDMTFTTLTTSHNTDHFRSAATGNWNAPATWLSSADSTNWISATLAPDANAASISVLSGHTVTVSASTAASKVFVNTGSTLAINTAVTLTVNHTVAPDLTVNGTLTNAGTGILALGTSAVAQVNGTMTFAGSTSSITGANATSLICNTGSSVSFAGTGTQSIPATTYYNLMLSSSGTKTAAGSFDVTGTLTTSATSVILNNTALMRIFNIRNFTMTSGSIDFGTTDVTDSVVTSTTYITGDLAKSGGTWTNSSSTQLYDIYFSKGGTQSVSNSGTLKWGSFNVSNNSTVTLASALPITGVTGTFITVDAGSVLSANTYIISTTVSPCTLAVNGKLQTANANGIGGSTSTTLSSTNTPVYAFGTNATVEYNAAGSQAITARTDYPSLSLAGSGTKTFGGTTTINGNLSVASGVVFANGTYTVTLHGNASNSGTHSGTGNIQLAGGTSAHTISGAGVFQNLVLNDTKGAVLGGNSQIAGTLTLTAGILSVGADTLCLETTAAIAGTPSASAMIMANGTGALVKKIADAQTLPYAFTFPLGDTAGTVGYSPATITVTSGVFSGASLAAAQVNGKHPNIKVDNNYLNRYWTLSSSGITDQVSSVELTYASSAVVGFESNLYGGIRTGSTWTNAGRVDSLLHRITASGLTVLGNSFTAASAAALANGAPFTLKIIPEGYYNSVTDLLKMTDTLHVYLANSTAPYAFVDTSLVVIDSATFSGNAMFSKVSNGTYYVVVKGRAILETWSANGIAITAGEAASYDFTTAATQAYGSNEVQKGTRWCVFCGDVDQSGYIDNNDLLLIDNAAFAFTAGYAVADLDGTRYVDNNDLLICDNNAFSFRGSKKPSGTTSGKVSVTERTTKAQKSKD